jgi:hypothetical protein
MTLSIRPDVGLSMQMSVLKPAVYLVPGLVISDFAAAHESGNGPERQFLDVRCGAALGSQADVARTNRKGQQRPPKHHDADSAPKGAVFDSRAPIQFSPERGNSLSRRRRHRTSVRAGFLSDLRKRGVKKST